MKEIYLNTEDFPINCGVCDFCSKNGFCYPLKQKVNVNNIEKPPNCPLADVSFVAKFYSNLLKSVLASHYELMQIYEFAEMPPKQFLEYAKDFLDSKEKGDNYG